MSEQPTEATTTESSILRLLGSKQERLYAWGAIAVLLLLVIVLITTVASQSSRIERLELATWQSQTWAAGSAGTTASSTERPERSERRRGAETEKGKTGQKPYSERRAQRLRESALANLETFITDNAVAEEHVTPLRETVEGCLDRLDSIRQDSTEEDRRGLLQASTTSCIASVGGVIGEEAASELETQVFRKPERGGEGGREGGGGGREGGGGGGGGGGGEEGGS